MGQSLEFHQAGRRGRHKHTGRIPTSRPWLCLGNTGIELRFGPQASESSEDTTAFVGSHQVEDCGAGSGRAKTIVLSKVFPQSTD
jgi:hypothetical protein